jgi:hypothetical protein
MRSTTSAVIVMAILIADLSAPSSSSASAAPPPLCGRKAAETTVAFGPEVLVRRRYQPPSNVFVACNRRTGRRTVIDSWRSSDEPDHFVDRVHVAGRYVAFVNGDRAACSSCSGGAGVNLFNSRTRTSRVLGGSSGITDLVVDTGGRVGWITFVSANQDPAGGQAITVNKADAAGPSVLASTDVVIGSLRLSNRVLSWLQRDHRVERMLQ